MLVPMNIGLVERSLILDIMPRKSDFLGGEVEN